MSDSIEARVARGAALLDEHRPEWWREIDLGSLDLQNACRCVLGQLYGTFYLGAARLDIMLTDGVALGFDGTPSCDLDALRTDFRALDEAWIATIKDRWERLA